MKDAYGKILNALERAKSRKSKSEGLIEALMQQLKEEFGLISMKDAYETLKDLEKEAQSMDSRAEKLLEKFERTWSGHL